MTEETPAHGQRPAAASSPLAGLRARRQQVVEALFVDYAVPRYDPPIFVRFRPVDDAQAQKINKDASKSKDNDINVVANANALAHACIGVFEMDGDTEVSIDPENRSSDPEDWPTFNSRLGELLGLPDAAGAVAVVRSLYATDGDVLATAQKVAEWSGYSLDAVEEREGN